MAYSYTHSYLPSTHCLQSYEITDTWQLLQQPANGSGQYTCTRSHTLYI